MCFSHDSMQVLRAFDWRGERCWSSNFVPVLLKNKFTPQLQSFACAHGIRYPNPSLGIFGQHWYCDSVQVFLMMMCNLKWGVFVFFGLWQTVALVFTILLVPETRGVPIEKASSLPLKTKLFGSHATVESSKIFCNHLLKG